MDIHVNNTANSLHELYIQQKPNGWAEKGMPFSVLYMNSINPKNKFQSKKVKQNKNKCIDKCVKRYSVLPSLFSN